jgi:NitT/TauT family transport system ATP-binding protein
VITQTADNRKRIAPVSIPFVTPAEAQGLLSLLGDEPCDLFDLSEKLGKEFGDVISLVKATELLGFVQTPGHDVIITPLGRELVNASTADQKRIVREQLMKLKIFELLVRLIKVQEGQVLPSEELIRELQAALPHEKPRQLFRTLMSWGRYAEIISLDQRRHIIRLYEPRTPGRPRPAAPAPSAPPAAVPSASAAPAPSPAPVPAPDSAQPPRDS